MKSWGGNIQSIQVILQKADYRLSSSNVKQHWGSFCSVPSTCDEEEVGALLPADRNLLFLLSVSIIWHHQPPPLFQLRHTAKKHSGK